MFFKSLLTTAVLASSVCIDHVAASAHGHHAQQVRNRLEKKRAAAESSMPEETDCNDFKYLTPETERKCLISRVALSASKLIALAAFRVDHLPDVPFDIGEMYSGLMPIDMDNKNRSLFFVFQPALGEPTNDLTIWLNGGPGCSSLEGFLQENGRFTWKPGTFAPVVNDYSWTRLTNMLWYVPLATYPSLVLIFQG